MRYLKKMKFDNKTFVSQIIYLAVKGVLKIIEDKKEYTITHIPNTNISLNNFEEKFINDLTFSTTKKIIISQTHNNKIQKAKKILADNLSEEKKIDTLNQIPKYYS